MKVIDIYDNGQYENTSDRLNGKRLHMLSRMGHDISVIRRKGCMADYLTQKSDVKTVTSGFGFLSRLMFPARIPRLIGDSDSCVIHTYSMPMAWMAAMTARSMNDRRVKVVLEIPVGYEPEESATARATLEAVDGLIFHSAADRKVFCDTWAAVSLAGKRIDVIPPGIVLPDTVKEPDRSHELVLIWGGHITAGCGLMRVADAMGMTHTTPVKMVVAGCGVARDSVPLLKHIKSLGLNGRWDFLGDEALTTELICDADALIIADSAQPDAFENGVTAMASGVPLVLPESARMHELGQNDVNAIFFDPDDRESLPSVLRRMAGEPELRQRLGKAARAKAEAQYDLRFHTDNLLHFYTTLFT